MLLCKLNELIDVGFDGLHAALHGGDAVTMPLQTHALSPHSTETPKGQQRGPDAVRARKIAAENEDLIGLQLRDSVGGVLSVVHNLLIQLLISYIALSIHSAYTSPLVGVCRQLPPQLLGQPALTVSVGGEIVF